MLEIKVRVLILSLKLFSWLFLNQLILMDANLELQINLQLNIKVTYFSIFQLIWHVFNSSSPTDSALHHGSALIGKVYLEKQIENEGSIK